MDKINKVTETLKNIQLDETPPWAQVLVSSIRELVEAVKECNVCNERLLQLEDISEVRGNIITNLQKDNADLREKLLKVKQAVDSNEQKSRSSCLVLHGVKETMGENTDQIVLETINDKVGVLLTLDDISVSHRIGPKKEQNTRRTKPRAIIFRFISMRKRMEVFRSKKNLKGTNVVITENLTSDALPALLKAKTKFGEKNVWTSEGKVFTKFDDKLMLISSEADLVSE